MTRQKKKTNEGQVNSRSINVKVNVKIRREDMEVCEDMWKIWKS